MTYKATYSCDGCRREIKGGYDKIGFELRDNSAVERDRRLHFHSFACLRKFVMNGGD